MNMAYVCINNQYAGLGLHEHSLRFLTKYIIESPFQYEKGATIEWIEGVLKFPLFCHFLA